MMMGRIHQRGRFLLRTYQPCTCVPQQMLSLSLSLGGSFIHSILASLAGEWKVGAGRRCHVHLNLALPRFPTFPSRPRMTENRP